MTFAAIDWLTISINLLLLIFVFVCLLMILLILMQRPKQEGLGAAFGSGVTDQVFGARTTNVLQRGTVYLGSLFFFVALTLAVLISHKNKGITLAKKPAAIKIEQKQEPKPQENLKPKSLSEELPAEKTTPASTAPTGKTEEKTPSDTPVPNQGALGNTPPIEVTPPAVNTPASSSEEKSGKP